MSSTVRDLVTAILCVAMVVLASFVAGRMTAGNGAGETIVVKVDTLFIRDTLTVYKPKWETKTVIDSVLVPVTDSVIVNDTVYVALAREQVVWEDSLARVYASGIQPEVDSVTHFIETVIINRETVIRKDCKWGLGVQLGAGAGTGGLTPYVGVGVSYNFLSW